MSLETAAPRRRLRGPARRAQIVRQAVAAFATNGYGPTSMGDIADHVGVTRAVLYDHFPSKKALYLAVLGEQGALFVGHIGAAINLEAGPGRRMRSTMEAVFGFAEQYPDAWRLLFVNSRNGEPDVDEAWRQAWDARVDGVAALLADDLERADVPTTRHHLIVELLVGALSTAAERARLHRDVARDELLEAAWSLLWVGMRNLGGSDTGVGEDPDSRG